MKLEINSKDKGLEVYPFYLVQITNILKEKWNKFEDGSIEI